MSIPPCCYRTAKRGVQAVHLNSKQIYAPTVQNTGHTQQRTLALPQNGCKRAHQSEKSCFRLSELL